MYSFTNFKAYRDLFWCQGKEAAIARWLVIGIVISMTQSFALTGLLEFSLYLLFTLNKYLRSRLISTFFDVRVKALMLFWLWVAISGSWGEAAPEQWFSEWWSWRKLLLVPICLSLFESGRHQKTLAYVVIITSVLHMIASWALYFDLIAADIQPAEVLENHSAQGLYFAMSLFLCLSLAKTSHDRKHQILLAVLGLGFLLNTMIVSTGRSAYLAISIVVMYIAFLEIRGKWRFIGVLGAFAIVLGMLTVSTTPRERIQQAFFEAAEAFEKDASHTSIGVRMVMWTNTIELIAAKPFFGSGAGAFALDYSAHVAGVDGWQGGLSDDPHQQYLHIAAEHGLLGLLIFLFSIGIWFRSAINASNPYAKFALVILIVTILNSFANGHFSAFIEGRLCWIFLAVFLPVVKHPR